MPTGCPVCFPTCFLRRWLRISARMRQQGRWANWLGKHLRTHAAMIKVPGSSLFLLRGRAMASTESRRQPILAAMIRVVGAKGYKNVSVADVIEEAGTSRTTFYKHFDDKHECFIAAYEMLVEQVFAEVVANCDGEAPWLSRMTDGLTTIVDRFALDPALARTAVVEVAAAGADARRLHWDAIARFTEYLDAGRELAGGKQ